MSALTPSGLARARVRDVLDAAVDMIADALPELENDAPIIVGFVRSIGNGHADVQMAGDGAWGQLSTLAYCILKNDLALCGCAHRQQALSEAVAALERLAKPPAVQQ